MISGPAPKLFTADRKPMWKRGLPELESVSTCTSRGYFWTRSGRSGVDAARAPVAAVKASASASSAERVALTSRHDIEAPDGVCENRPLMSSADTKAQIAQALDRF